MKESKASGQTSETADDRLNTSDTSDNMSETQPTDDSFQSTKEDVTLYNDSKQADLSSPEKAATPTDVDIVGLDVDVA